VALSGGSTPTALFELLASTYAGKLDWSKVEVYFCDERCVPPEHAESNFKLARDTLLSRLPISQANIHRMKGEIDPNTAAIEYGRMLKARFGDDGVDLAILGMGEDGHTASLFPQTPALAETHHRCVAQFVEKSTTGLSWRISLTPPFLNRSHNVLVLVSGAAKAQTLKTVLNGPRDPERLPIQLIDPIDGEMLWLADAAAAGKLAG
jgi:6-phosphogluconolactonase